MKRILFYTHNIFTKENPEGYRIQQYFPYLEKQGFKIQLLTTKANPVELLKSIQQSDITYIQRVLPNPLKLSLFRRLSKRMVYDFDDAVMYGSRGSSSTRRSRFEGMIRASDIVFCGNRFLLEEAKKFKTEGIHYIPTVVNTDEYPVKSHEDKKPFVVGWMGSSSTLKYLSDMKELFLSFHGNRGINFKFVADKPSEMEGEGILFEKWEKDREKSSLLSFDMGIMPARDDIWSRGKCGLKLIQYMAAGLPSITHPVGVAKDMIKDGVNGFLRNDTDGWKGAIEALFRDVRLRKNMGEVSRTIAEEKYSLKVWGPKVAEIVGAL
ncbi:MAG: glycosyltransferase family 4 protein [Proteobacteria bacterium]|nr:glycosyltransferase family 4 protein [Pseudomonadota bacterium]